MAAESTLPQVLGTAEFVANYKNNSPEWLELRRSGFGGSEVATCLGLNPWESALTLWYKRTNRIDSEVLDNPAMEWGRRLESVVMAKFKEDHPELEVWDDVGTWRNNERRYQLVNPDGIYRDADGNYGIIEIKTAAYKDDWAYGVPKYYKTQVQYYLNAFGFDNAHVVLLVAGRDYNEFELPADDFQQAVDLAAVERFLNCVENDTRPDWDGSNSTYETVRKMHPQIEDGSVELNELYVLYKNHKAAAAAADARLTEVKSQIMDLMGLAKNGLYDGKVVMTRTAKGQGLPYLMEKR